MPANVNQAGAVSPLDLAAAFRESDAAAAEVAATTLLPLATRLIRRLTAWSVDADDLVQDVLVAALASRAKFRGQSTLETWVTRIAVNCCRAHARRQWLRTRLFGDWARRTHHDRTSVVGETSAERAAIEQEQAQRVRAAVAQLPTRNREAIVLCYLEGMSVEDAAAALGIRRGTLEVRLTRARQQLRKLLAHDLVIKSAFLDERPSR